MSIKSPFKSPRSEGIIPRTIKTSELQLADKIYSPDNYDLGNSVVKQIKEGMITLFRPYPITENFSYTGGVICSIGIDEYTICQDSDRKWILISRKELK